MKALKWAAFWLLLIVLGVVAAWYFMAHWRPTESQYPVQGITVGQEQGDVHWPTVRAAGAEFAYIMATNGDTGRDANFAENWAGARAAGIRYGAVHVWQLCRLAADQATNFIATVPQETGALPPAVMLQFEDNCADRPDLDVFINELSTFLDEIETHAESPALIYVSREFDEMYEITSRVERSFWLRRRLFQPDYGVKPWVMWEANDMRRVNGVDNPARWNVVRPQQPPLRGPQRLPPPTSDATEQAAG